MVSFSAFPHPPSYFVSPRTFHVSTRCDTSHRVRRVGSGFRENCKSQGAERNAEPLRPQPPPPPPPPPPPALLLLLLNTL